MNYEQLLDKAYKNVKETFNSGERFKMIDIKVEVTGNKTVICNFSQILSHIHRNPEAFCKFLSKELAAHCKQEEDRLIINRKIPIQMVIDKVNLYVNKFVLCKECGKPDTGIFRESGLTFIHCLACGAKHSLGNV